MTSIIIPGQVTRPAFDESKHVYTVGGKRVPSVSRILRPLTTAVYGDIDHDTLRKAAEFGTAVHACTELLDLNELDETSVAAEWRPYVDAYVKWKETFHPDVLHIEDQLACSKYAGTLDRIARTLGRRSQDNFVDSSARRRSARSLRCFGRKVLRRHIQTSRPATTRRRLIQGLRVLIDQRRNLLQRSFGHLSLDDKQWTMTRR